MNNKKKIIIAIIILLLIGLTVFAFASGKDNDDDNNVNATNTNKVVNNTTDDGKTNSTTNSTTNNTTNNAVNNTTNSGQASNTTTNNTNTTTDNSQTNTTSTETNNESTEDEVDDSYEKALAAVENAEDKLDQDSYDAAEKLVEKVTDSDKKSELESRLEEVANAIETKELVESLSEMVENAESVKDIDEARDFADENEVGDKVSKLTNEDLKEELTETLDEILNVLNDETAPEVNIEDEAILNKETAIQITDDNEFEATLTKDGEEVSFENGDTARDGVYTLTVVDKAFNETTVNFTIDTIAPEGVVSYSKTVPTNEDVVATLSVNESIQDIEGWTKTDDKSFTKTYSENTTEDITIIDIAGNSATVAVEVTNIDRVAPEVVSFETEAQSSSSPMIKATVTFDEKVTISDNTWSSSDSLTYTSTFTMSLDGIIEFTDEAGNTNTYSYSIDATAPMITISYDPSVNTDKAVTATITSDEDLQDIEGWTKVSATEFTKVYEENTTESVIVKDLVGNTTTVNIEITNIDKTAPEITVSYSTEDPTNENVTATINSNEDLQDIEGWTKVSATEFTKVYEENTTETFTVLDLVGNQATANISITNIDRVAPEVSVSYDNTDPTKDNVVATITSSKDLQDIEGWTKVSATEFTKIYEENTTESVEVKDLAGNTATANIEITNIDKTAPEITVSYSTEDPTNESVVATISSNEDIQDIEGWTKVSAKEFNKEFAYNATETITVSDLLGNTATINVVIENIDKTAPTVSISSYSTTEPTNGEVVVTVTSDEKLQETDGWAATDSEKTYAKTYNDNATETVTFYDLAGNTATVNIEITNIDKTAPTLNVSYSETNPTNQNVIATITSDEDIQDIEGWVKVDTKTFTKEYAENASETITATDLVGNSSTANIVIENIDRVAPIISISYSETNPTNQDVTVTLSASEKLQDISGWTTDDNMTFTKAFDGNVNESITVYDLAGNEATDNIVIENIDKVAPNLEVGYSETNPTNQNVTATITSDKDLQDIEGWTKVSSTKFIKEYTDNINESVIVYDLVGNSATATITITNIDKVAPEVSSINQVVTGSTFSKTNRVTLIFSEKVTITSSGWTKVSDTEYYHDYTRPTNVTVDFKDTAGNTNSYAFTPDLTNPSVTVSYSTTSYTSGPVTVTITGNEDLQDIDGWTRVDAKTFTKVYTANTNTSVTVKDLAGNTATARVRINNIH